MDKGNEWRYEVTVIKAEADGVGPSLLLSAARAKGKGNGKGPEYLFNVPEGFSRLVLEHKVRPSARLASVFLTSLRPHCAGGLGGLLLRLAGDGHGQLQLIGPDCTSAFLYSLRHITYWRHPKVFVCDCHPYAPLPVFDDDFVSVYPLLPNGNILSCPWCEDRKHGYNENKRDKDSCTDVRLKSRYQFKSFHDIACSGSDDEVDSFTYSRLEGSKSLELESHKSIPTRHMIRKDNYMNNGKILNDSAENSEGERIQVKEECQLRRCGSGISEYCGCLNGKRKKDGSEHLLASAIEKFLQDEEFPGEGGMMNDFSEQYNERGFKGYTNSSVMDTLLSSCKRKRGSMMSGLKRPSLLDSEAGNKLVSEVLQSSTYPSTPSMKCCSKSSSKLAVRTELQMRKVTLDSGEQELYLANMLHEKKSKLAGTGDCVVPFVGINDISKRKDSMHSGLSSGEQNLHAANDNTISVEVRDEETNDIFLSRGQENHCHWRVNNSLEMELPNLPAGAIPMYVKRPPCGVNVINEELLKQNELDGDRLKDDQSPLKRGQLIGFACYMKKVGSTFIVVDCDTPELADELDQNPIFSSIFSCNAYKNDQNRCLHPVSAVFHLSPPSMLRSEKYMKWMTRLGDDVLHVMMESGSIEYGFLHSFSTLVKMNMVSKEIFPLPFDASTCNQQMDAETFGHFNGQVKIGHLLTCVAFQESLGNKAQVVVDDSMCKININVEMLQKSFAKSRPDLTEKCKKVAEDIVASSQDAGMQMSANKMAALALREKLLQQRKLADMDSISQGVSTTCSNIYASNYSGAKRICRSLSNGRAISFKLLFLGTGSAEPMENRGSSGILLEVHDRPGMLLDAGEGVSGQIVRAFGNRKMRNVVQELQCVWISHKHADHVLGLISIIAARSKSGPDLLIVGSTAVHEWLQEVNRIYRRLGYSFASFTFVHCQEFMARHQGSSWSNTLGCEEAVSRMLVNLQLCSMRCVWVDHCFQACGLILSSVSGWSIVYSGDTRPCKTLIEAGMGCTLLIHEATFEDKFESHARAKRHSTISEALDVGQQMGAKHVILTHFSQRSPKIMGIDVPNKQNVSFAYDGMLADSIHLPALPGLMQCLVTLFDQYIKSMKHQNSKANLANQRQQFLEASDKEPNILLEEGIAPLGNGSRTGIAPSHTAMAITSMKLQSSERCSLPKHIRWNDSDTEDTPSDPDTEDTSSHIDMAVSTMKLDSLEQCHLPKHIRRNDSGPEDAPSNSTMAITSIKLQSSERCSLPKHIRWNDSDTEDTPSDPDTEDTSSHTGMAVSTMKLDSLEQCHLPKHIRKNDSGPEDAPSNSTVAIPSQKLQSSEQCHLPKYIRWNDSESEDE